MNLLSNFKWYRRMRGGRWYYIRLRNGIDCRYIWTQHAQGGNRHIIMFEDWGMNVWNRISTLIKVRFSLVIKK